MQVLLYHLLGKYAHGGTPVEYRDLPCLCQEDNIRLSIRIHIEHFELDNVFWRRSSRDGDRHAREFSESIIDERELSRINEDLFH